MPGERRLVTVPRARRHAELANPVEARRMTMSFTQRPSEAGLPGLIHQHWGLFLTEGVILTVLGLAAMLLPPIAGLATTIVLGWLFLIAGVVALIFTLRARQAPGFGWSLLSALVAMMAGIALLWNPVQGLVSLTYVLIAFFIFDGVLMIGLALAHRRELSGKWEWLMFNGVIDLVLAGIIIAGLPGTIAWALGVLVGIDMIFGGASLIAMALNARKTTVV
jgi:uncharacterized membrane protein HdeD (DUF308 family)